ncbi:hypothetical protein PCL_09521 [Purpureocillium lilacinum]|uniref:Endonuclease/exonuclease/phosphatase domain-containing protein n=1 Tax=Purpureocillium lilacinum TaxID=33203 RepID=A0A2U3DQR6_PURLI|nr:hypothetical protein PCL_09521 [Purpureocillium lilacinum]
MSHRGHPNLLHRPADVLDGSIDLKDFYCYLNQKEPDANGRRVVKRKIDDSGNESSRNGRYATRTAPKATPAKESGCTTDARNEISNGGDGAATLKHMAQLLGDCRAEFAGFKQMIRSQSELIRTQQETIQDLKETSQEQQQLIRVLTLALEDTRQQMDQELKALHDKLDVVAARAPATPPRSFADVARSPRSGPPATATPPAMATSSKPLDGPSAGAFFCTIDTSRVDEANRDQIQVGAVRHAVEAEMRAKDGQTTWRCAAVLKDARATERIKIICRDENELRHVREAAQKAVAVGAREHGAGRRRDCAARSCRGLGAENNVNIAKLSWLSNKESGKAYGSMVVYVTKESDARRLVDGHYFDLAGESATTNVFERRIGPVQCCNCQTIGHKSFQSMSETLSILQLNVRKREPVQQSLMNDETLKDYAVLAVSEPYARLVDDKVVTSPMWHNNWTKMIPTQKHDARWPIRSMLWVRSDIEAEQLAVPSADLTAAVLRLPERDSLVVSVYVQGNDAQILVSAMESLHGLIRSFRDSTGRRTDVVLVGDFNRHNLLWTGDNVSAGGQGEAEPIIDLMNEHGLCSLLPRGTRTWRRQDQESTIDLVLTTSELADEMLICALHTTDHGTLHGIAYGQGWRRQGEAEPIIDLMNEHGLCSLLPRGTRTWRRQDQESTIDLVLATSELADEMLTCALHATDHGSDHQAIQTTFDVRLPERIVTPRLLFKNAPWNRIRTRVEEGLAPLPWRSDVQTQTDQLMNAVTNAIHEMTPQSKPSQYAKRWWTGDLTRLRRTYAFWRNQARARRRAASACPDLERRAKEAAKQYHDAIRNQRKSHWDEFLAEDTNIWKAAKYLEPGKGAMSDKVPPLRRMDGTTTTNRAEQTEQLLETFFPPLSIFGLAMARLPYDPTRGDSHLANPIDRSFPTTRARTPTSKERERLLALGLYYNEPEPAVLCLRCGFALKTGGDRVSRHLGEKHDITRKARWGLNKLVQSLHLPDPNRIACEIRWIRSPSSPCLDEGRHLQTLQLSVHQSCVMSDPRHLPQLCAAVGDDNSAASRAIRERAEEICRQEKMYLAAGAATASATAMTPEQAIMMTNWMRRTGWEDIFEKAHRGFLVALSALPQPGTGPLILSVSGVAIAESPEEDESKLHTIVAALDRLLDRCGDTLWCDPAWDECLPPVGVSHELSSDEDDGLCQDDDDCEDSELEDDDQALTDDDLEEVDANDSADNDLCYIANGEVLIEQDPQADILLRFCSGMVTEDFQDGKASSTLLVYFGAVCGLSLPEGAEFLRPGQYTTHLSGFIYCARLIMLESVLPRASHDYINIEARPPKGGHLEALQELRRSKMCDGTMSPLGELFGLLAFGTVLRQSDGPTFHFEWSDDGEVISWDGDHRLSMSAFRGLVQTLLQAATKLCRRLMYDWEPPKPDFKRIRDRLSASSTGYSFVTDPANGLADAYLEVLSRACRAPIDGLLQWNPGGEGCWDVKAVTKFIERHDELLKMLMLLFHLGSGQGSRISELLSIEHCNTPSRLRGIGFYAGYMFSTTRHHKARLATNNEFQVARFLPESIALVAYDYLVYIRRTTPAARVTQWKADTFSRALQAFTNASPGISFGIGARLYRQISIAITERHIRSIAGYFNRNDDTSPNSDSEVAFAWQSGHRPRQRNSTYGLDGAFPDQLQPGLLRLYLEVSKQWHAWLQLREAAVTRRATCLASNGDDSGHSKMRTAGQKRPFAEISTSEPSRHDENRDETGHTVLAALGDSVGDIDIEDARPVHVGTAQGNHAGISAGHRSPHSDKPGPVAKLPADNKPSADSKPSPKDDVFVYMPQYRLAICRRDGKFRVSSGGFQGS